MHQLPSNKRAARAGAGHDPRCAHPAQTCKAVRPPPHVPRSLSLTAGPPAAPERRQPAPQRFGQAAAARGRNACAPPSSGACAQQGPGHPRQGCPGGMQHQRWGLAPLLGARFALLPSAPGRGSAQGGDGLPLLGVGATAFLASR